jgi:hypothetical protein
MICLLACSSPSRFPSNERHMNKHSFTEVYIKDTLIKYKDRPPRRAQMLLFYCRKDDCKAKDVFYLYED